jgi:vacuolar protein sorting-associated protein 35
VQLCSQSTSTAEAMAFIGGDDQDRLLDEATAVVKEQAYYMKRAIDNDNLREALKHSSNMICELRTSQLSPKNYYELYMQVFQQMQEISNFFGDKNRHGRKYVDLYESVQHAGNILPRLYLLATVGASYIKSGESPAKEILNDMSELCKGVQHPMRGLFLRYYLSQMVKDRLPDTGSEYEEAGGGDINDAFNFILSNLEESNKLWVRMQNQGPMKDKPKREKERHDLRVLVGSNLVRLSQLDGMTTQYYAENALPRILEHVLSIKDTMSQQYMFESMIQVFPDAFHIQTLEQVLASYTKAQPTVDMKPIMTALMKRLSEFLNSEEATATEHALTGVDIFAMFRTHLQAILERTLEPSTGQASSMAPDIAAPLEVQVAFMNFTLSLYPDKIHYVDIILGSTCDLLQKYFGRLSETGGGSNKKLSSPGAEKVVELLSHPVKNLSLAVLDMDQYPILLGYLNYQTRKQVALSFVNTIVEENIALTNAESVASLFTFISPLVKDEPDMPADEGNDAETFAREQQNVCKLVHQVRADDMDTEYAVLNAMRSQFGAGGPKRIVHTLQPIIYAAMGFVGKLKKFAEEQQRLVDAGEEAPPAPAVSVKKVFQFLHKTTTVLNEKAADVALRLWLIGAELANKVDEAKPGDYEAICNEFLTQGLVVFEEEISEDKRKNECLYLFIGTLCTCSCLDPENYDGLTVKLIGHCGRLLKKPMQCRSISSAAAVFWCPHKQEGKRVLECLQKCLKVCDAAVQSDPKQVGLWVEMLDKYVYFIEKGVSEVGVKFVSSLLNLCNEHISYAEANEESAKEAAKARNHLLHSKRYIKSLQQQGDEIAEIFREVDLN